MPKRNEAIAFLAGTARRTALAFALVFGAALDATAADLRVGIKADPSVDPHFLYLAPNIAVARHLFDALTGTDADERLEPKLAESWRAVGEREWEFTLREGVRFHDGSPLTADDVVFSFERVRSIPNNPNPYTAGLRSVAGVSAAGPRTVRVTTSVPNPMLPMQLRSISIVPRAAAQGAMPADFASGRAAVGTGPFRFVRFAPGDRLVLARNADYWGPPVAWDSVTFRILTNDAARLAALLARDVDVVDFVPPQDLERLRRTEGVEVFARESDRIMYLALNGLPDRMPWFTDRGGRELEGNPFRDARVRLAVSKAVDRRALVARGLDGMGVPAMQMVPSGFGGHDPSVPIEPADPAGARTLLREAGYPEGFGITVHCSNGRYVNDSGVCQVLGAMLSRAGFAARVEVLPPNMYFSRVPASNPQFALMLLGWGMGTGTAMTALTDAMHSHDPAKGMGANARGTNNPEMDAIIERASRSFDEAERTALMRQALAVIRRDTVAVPLYAEMTVLAARRGIWVEPRADQQTIVVNARPVR